MTCLVSKVNSLSSNLKCKNLSVQFPVKNPNTIKEKIGYPYQRNPNKDKSSHMMPSYRKYDFLSNFLIYSFTYSCLQCQKKTFF